MSSSIIKAIKDTKTNRGVSTAKAAKTAMSASIEAEEGQNMDIEAITHGFVLLVVHLKELKIWVHLSKLTYLQRNQHKHNQQTITQFKPKIRSNSV